MSIRGQITRADSVLHDVCRYIKNELINRLNSQQDVTLPYTAEMDTLCNELMAVSNNRKIQDFAREAKEILHLADIVCSNSPNAVVHRAHLYTPETGRVEYIKAY